MELFAQIGGISGSKLNAVCVDVVDHHVLEFEPAFTYSQSSKYWDNGKHLTNIYSTSDSLNRASGMQFRFTYGLFDKLEIGVTVPDDISMSSWGARYVIAQKEKLGFAVIAGVNIPMGNEVQYKAVRTEANTWQTGLGAVMSYQYSENFSIDFNMQYNAYTRKLESGNKGTTNISADAGYYFFDKGFQLIAGMGYQHTKYDAMDQFLYTFYPGVTIETGKNYIIVLTTPIDIYGKNIDKTFNFSFALTLNIP